MNAKAVMGTLICLTTVVMQDIDIFAQPVGSDRLERLSQSKSIDMRYSLEENVSVKKTNIDVSVELGSLAKNDTVEVIEDMGEWLKVRYKGEVGYVKSKYLTTKNKNGRVMYIEHADKVSVYSDADNKSKILGSIAGGEKVNVIEQVGDYIRIYYNGDYAYIKNIDGILVDKVTRIVKTSTVLRNKNAKDMNLNSAVLNKGDEVVVLENSENYTKVSIDGREGYVPRSSLADFQYVNSEDMKVESLLKSANISSTRKTYIPPKSKVEVIGYEGDYAKVLYGDYEGYVKKSVLSKECAKVKVSNFVGEYMVESKYGIDKITQDIKDFIENEIGSYKKTYSKLSSIEIFRKEEKKIISMLEKYMVEKYGIRKIQENSNVEVVRNLGAYFEIVVDEESYFVMNKGIDAEDKDIKKVSYIQSEPSYNRTTLTRYTNTMDVKVYSLVKNKLDSEIEDTDLIELGYLVEDASLEFIKELNSGYSLVNLNGVRCVINNTEISTKKMYTEVQSKIAYYENKKSHKLYVDKQMKKLNTVSNKGGMERASYEDVAFYTNPNKNSVWKNKSKYQFLRIDKFRNVNVYELNQYLNSIELSGGKKSIFKNKGDVFVKAAKEYNIDPIYLVSHTLLETGYGGSKLAQGIEYKNKGKVYNFFGIGAVDSSPIAGGTSLAYKKGWTSVDKTIIGSAKWLSDNYINNNLHKQNTLYKMRFNITGSHQYASDVAWAYKISGLMNELSYLYEDTELNFEVPKYINGSYVSKNPKQDEDNKEEDGKDSINEVDEEELVESEKPNKPGESESGSVTDKPNKPGESESGSVTEKPNKPGESESGSVTDKPNKPGESESGSVTDKPNKPGESESGSVTDKPNKPGESEDTDEDGVDE